MTDFEFQPGAVAAREWRTSEIPGVIQVVGGVRHVLVWGGLRPYPWPSMQTRRDKRGLKYHDWREATRQQVLVACRRDHVGPWSKGALLGIACAFGAASRRYVAESRAVSIRDWDLRNLEKAIEDVLTGVLYYDDRQIRYAGPGSARDDSEDWFAVHVWDGDRAWDPAWADESVPEVYVE